MCRSCSERPSQSIAMQFRAPLSLVINPVDRPVNSFHRGFRKRTKIRGLSHIETDHSIDFADHGA